MKGVEFMVLQGDVQTLTCYLPVIYIGVLRKWCAKFGHTAMDVFNLLYHCGYFSFTIRGNRLELRHGADENTIDTHFVFKKKMRE